MNETTTPGAIALDDSTCSATVAGQAVELTAQEFRVLKALTTKPGVTVGVPEIELALYGSQEKAAASNVVEVLVMRIRRKLAGAGIERVLVTRRGLGYSYVGMVA